MSSSTGPQHAAPVPPHFPRPPPPPSTTHDRRLNMDYNTYFNTQSSRAGAYPPPSCPSAQNSDPAPSPPIHRLPLPPNKLSAPKLPPPSQPPPSPRAAPSINPSQLPAPPPPSSTTPRASSPSFQSHFGQGPPPPPPQSRPSVFSTNGPPSRPSVISTNGCLPPPPPSHHHAGPRQSIASTASKFSTGSSLAPLPLHQSTQQSHQYDKEMLRRPSQFSTNPHRPQNPLTNNSNFNLPPSSHQSHQSHNGHKPSLSNNPTQTPTPTNMSFAQKQALFQNTSQTQASFSHSRTPHASHQSQNSFNSHRSTLSNRTTSSNGTTIVHQTDPLHSNIQVNTVPVPRNPNTPIPSQSKTPIKTHTLPPAPNTPLTQNLPNPPTTPPTPRNKPDEEGEVVFNGSFIFFSPKPSIVSRRDTAALQNILKEAAGTPSQPLPPKPIIIEEFEGYDDDLSMYPNDSPLYRQSTTDSPTLFDFAIKPTSPDAQINEPSLQSPPLPLPPPPVPVRPIFDTIKSDLKFSNQLNQALTPTQSFDSFLASTVTPLDISDPSNQSHSLTSVLEVQTPKNENKSQSPTHFHSTSLTPTTQPPQFRPSQLQSTQPQQFSTLMRLQSLHLKSSDISINAPPIPDRSSIASPPHNKFDTSSRFTRPNGPPPPLSQLPLASSTSAHESFATPAKTTISHGPAAMLNSSSNSFGTQTSSLSHSQHQRLLQSPSTLTALNQQEYQQAIEEYNEQLQKEAYAENDYGHYHGMDIKKNSRIDEKVQKLWRLAYAESRRIQSENWEYFEEQCIHTEIPIYLALRNTKPGQLLVRDGIPIRQRASIWAQLLQIDTAKRSFPTFYPDCVAQITIHPTKSSKDIAKDVRRTMQYHELFQSNDGIEMLSNILSVFSFKFPKIGYCQSMNVLASTLLLFYTEQDSYYMLESLLTSSSIIPACYYTDNLIDVKTDVQVLIHYIRKRFPAVYKKIVNQFDIDLATVFIPWFMCLYVEILPLETAMRLWDIMFTEGCHTILFRVGLFIVWLLSNDIVGDSNYNTNNATITRSATTAAPKTAHQQHTCTSPGDVFMLFSQTPSQLLDVDSFIHFIHQPSSICYLTKAQIDKNRKRYRKQIEHDFVKSLKFLERPLGPK